MGRTMLKTRRKLVCPSCNAAIHFRPERDNLGTCPRCGERLVRSGRWKRRLERLDREPSTDFDEYNDWERLLLDTLD
ncbi:hypothetical protein KAW44_07675 [Candidatus Bipolaricaulota bacterium]|nr:hypothetical protein [Candidatus Bipolaricaulota bacterium]